jgi:long-chain fatty acid transport protein
MKNTIAIAALCAAALLARPVHAAGFAIETHHARATGMATAVTALSDDPSAAFYNPAMLLGGDGLELSLGASLIMPRVTFTSQDDNVSRVGGLSPPPHLLARYQLMDQVAAGVGVFVPFGASSAWPEGWEGRFRTTGSNLNVWVINPEVAVEVHERVQLGAGVQIVRGTVLLNRALNFVDSEGAVSLGGGTWATSFNVGTNVEILKDRLNFGASWRPGARLDFDGRASFTDVPVEFQSRLADQRVQTSVKLPDMVFAGFGYRALQDRLRLGLDAHWYDWSGFRSLDLNFEDEDLSSSLPKRWHDTVSVHLGAEYRVTREVTARGGLAYDPTPSPPETLTPDLPDANRVRFAVGGGYRLGDFQFDAAYQLVLLTGMESTSPFFPGTYGGMAHVVGLTLGWNAPF